MLNSKPNNSKFHQGNFIPKNKDKVLKLNNQGGLFFRSSWEKKIMQWLDANGNIVIWGAECLRIPYQMTHVVDGIIKIKEHSYFPDFYYGIKSADGSIKYVVAEVKPKADYNDVMLFKEGKFIIPDKLSLKKLQSLEYKFKMSQRNSEKWDTMIKWCDMKGYAFIIITEDNLARFS